MRRPIVEWRHRAHRALLCLLLAAGALWLGRAALLSHNGILSAEALLALVALGCAAAGSRFTRYPVLLLALCMGGEWIASTWFSFRIGYFSHLAAPEVLGAVLPGALLIGVLLYACVVAIAACRG